LFIGSKIRFGDFVEGAMGGKRIVVRVLMTAAIVAVGCAASFAQGTWKAVGEFEGSGDVGTVLHAGDVEFDAAKGTYTMAGSGENVWGAADAFQFAWKRVDADSNVVLTADISFLGVGKNEHRKAMLMVRQSLDADAAYVDVALHGNGLTSLQFRNEKGGATHEVQTIVNAPKRVKIEKHGDYFTMWVAGEDGKFQLAAASPGIAFEGQLYVGIGLCSHEKDVVEKAEFSKVEVKKADSHQSTADSKDKKNVAQPGMAVPQGLRLYSMMEIMNAESGDRRAIYVTEGRFEAPNWMPDGKRLLFNRNGKIETLAVTGGTTQTIDTGFAVRCNNDHGISPDGKTLVVSDQSQNAEHTSQVYVLPITGGTPQLVTKNAPSYWHGWSPDGKTLAFVGERGGEFDIYAISPAGGDEKRLTTAPGLDDGPEYSPDGKYIYFNSERTGHMQIWRMKADGSEQEQVTFGEGNDWFPHFSPDGERMVFITFDASVKGHPENKDVELRMMTMKDKKIRVVAKLFGGQGTMNVPSWSPDGKEFAFVSYAVMGEK
jgi:TolB protein